MTTPGVQSLLAALSLGLGLAGLPGAAASDGVVAPTTTATPAPLRGTTWRLIELGGAAVRPPAPGHGNPVPTLRLAPDSPRLAGHGGCNAMSAPFELEGAKLRIGPVIGSSMACEHGMDRESAYAQMLEKVAGYVFEGRRLVLRGADGIALARFEPVP